MSLFEKYEKVYLSSSWILKRIWLFFGATNCVIKSRFITHRPFFISHLITSRCFAKCPTCLWRGKAPEENDTTKIIDFYRQAKQLGFVSTTIWGGEPLLRDDLFEILRECKKMGFITGIITIGSGYIFKPFNFIIYCADFAQTKLYLFLNYFFQKL